jgi:hypothetical protein
MKEREEQGWRRMMVRQIKGMGKHHVRKKKKNIKL